MRVLRHENVCAVGSNFSKKCEQNDARYVRMYQPLHTQP